MAKTSDTVGPKEAAMRAMRESQADTGMLPHQRAKRPRKVAAKPDPAPPAKAKKAPKKVAAPAPPTVQENWTLPYAKAVRVLTGLTQAEFAAKHGFSRRTVEGWERGASEPRGQARDQLAKIEAKFAKEKAT